MSSTVTDLGYQRSAKRPQGSRRSTAGPSTGAPTEGDQSSDDVSLADLPATAAMPGLAEQLGLSKVETLPGTRTERWRYPADMPPPPELRELPPNVRSSHVRLSSRRLLRGTRIVFTSLVLHALLLLVAGWVVVAPVQHRPMLEIRGRETSNLPLEVVKLQPVALHIAGREDIAPQETEAQLPDPNPMIGILPAAVRFADAPRRAGPSGEVRALLGRAGQGMSLAEDAEGGAEFFGIQARGRRFVFVVDSSRSMLGTRWLDACDELLRSIEQLGPDRQFYVFFFDAESHAMLGSDRLELIPASLENLDNCRRWMRALELGFFTRPCKSVQRAVALQPDAIFLLSDGEFSDPTAHWLRRNNRIEEEGRLKIPAVTIHTIGFHSRSGEKLLRRIAQENGGTYRFIAPP